MKKPQKIDLLYFLIDFLPWFWFLYMHHLL